jgi:hypothetical protein
MSDLNHQRAKDVREPVEIPLTISFEHAHDWLSTQNIELFEIIFVFGT